MSTKAGIFISSSSAGSIPSSGGGGIEEAPIDGTPYVRQNGAWVPARIGNVQIVESGEILDPLTALTGVYYFETGSVMNNGPTTPLEMYSSRVTVFIPGVSINLTCYCKFNETAGYLHFGEWEYMPSENIWSAVGPNASANPAASESWTMLPFPALVE